MKKTQFKPNLFKFDYGGNILEKSQHNKGNIIV